MIAPLLGHADPEAWHPQTIRPLAETVSAIAAVGAVALPMSGYVERWTSFNAAGFGDPAHLAAALPFGELVGIGAGVVLFWAAVLLGWRWFFIRAERPRPNESPVQPGPRRTVSRRVRILVLVAFALVVLTAVAGVLFLAYSGTPIIVLLWVLALIPLSRDARRRLRSGSRLGATWTCTVLAVGSVGGAVFQGLFGDQAGTAVADVTFHDEVARDGRYVILGTDSGDVLLVPCTTLDKRNVVVVPQTDIVSEHVYPASAQLKPGPQASIQEVVSGAQSLHLGLPPTCP